mgnify:CR=1 FL=1
MDNVGVSSFQLVMMGAKRGKGTLKKTLDGGTAGQPTSSRSLNKGKGQEITGVTLPADGKNMKSNWIQASLSLRFIYLLLSWFRTCKMAILFC